MFRALSLLAMLASAFGTPPGASLLQSGSRSMASSSSTSGERSSSLAGFQTYAEGLAAKYLETALPLDSDMRAQIDTVLIWIDTEIAKHLEDGDKMDRQKVKDLSSDLTGCVASAQAEVALTKKMNGDTMTSRQTHFECRESEVGCVATTDQACQEYDAYRHEDHKALLPDCALTDFSDKYIQADEDDQSGNLQAMEACLILTKTWHSALYTLYAACRRADCVLAPSCLGVQHEFEAKHCEAKTKQDFVCNSFDLCVTGNEDPCDEIAIDVGARKADYEAGERIKCLLIVLRDAEDNCTGRSDEVPPCKEKPTELRKCTEKTYDTSSYNIVCSKPSVFSPPALDCGSVGGAVSCSQAFLDAEYSTYPFEHVEPCKCKQCLALGGDLAPVCPSDITGAWQDLTGSFYGGAIIRISAEAWYPEINSISDPKNPSPWITSSYELQRPGEKVDLVEVKANGEKWNHEAQRGVDGMLWIRPSADGSSAEWKLTKLE